MVIGLILSDEFFHGSQACCFIKLLVKRFSEEPLSGKFIRMLSLHLLFSFDDFLLYLSQVLWVLFGFDQVFSWFDILRWRYYGREMVLFVLCGTWHHSYVYYGPTEPRMIVSNWLLTWEWLPLVKWLLVNLLDWMGEVEDLNPSSGPSENYLIIHLLLSLRSPNLIYVSLLCATLVTFEFQLDYWRIVTISKRWMLLLTYVLKFFDMQGWEHIAWQVVGTVWFTSQADWLPATGKVIHAHIIFLFSCQNRCRSRH